MRPSCAMQRHVIQINWYRSMFAEWEFRSFLNASSCLITKASLSSINFNLRSLGSSGLIGNRFWLHRTLHPATRVEVDPNLYQAPQYVRATNPSADKVHLPYSKPLNADRPRTGLGSCDDLVSMDQRAKKVVLDAGGCWGRWGDYLHERVSTLPTNCNPGPPSSQPKTAGSQSW